MTGYDDLIDELAMAHPIFWLGLVSNVVASAFSLYVGWRLVQAFRRVFLPLPAWLLERLPRPLRNAVLRRRIRILEDFQRRVREYHRLRGAFVMKALQLPARERREALEALEALDFGKR